MDIKIFNKKTKNYNTLKTAKANGLIENPDNFIIGNNYVINKKTG
jgi:hypothetical protein